MGLIEKKVGDFSIGEAFAIGIAKTLSEQVLAPIIGNGTYMSGGAKLLMAWAVPKYVLKGSFGKTLGTAWAVDATEDIVNALFSDNFGVMGQEKSPLI